MLICPRKVYALDKISDGNDPIGGHSTAVDACHVSLSFGSNICGRVLPPGSDRPQCMRDAFPLDSPANSPALPITDVPAIADADDLTSLGSQWICSGSQKFCVPMPRPSIFLLLVAVLIS